MDPQKQNNIYDTSIRLLFLALIIAWCLLILLPFVSIILWAVILAIAFSPLHSSLSRWMGGREKLASTLIVLIGLAVILIPGWLFLDSIISGVKELKADFDGGTFTIPPPTENVKEWPLIGDSFYNIWRSASDNLSAFFAQYREQLAGIFEKLVKGILSVVSGGFQMIVSTIIAGILLVLKGSRESVLKVFNKLAGDRGEEFVDLTYKTVGNVVKGVLGVALIQAFLVGLGFLLSGVPLAGLWTLVALIFAILQLPVILIVLPVIIWLFSAIEILPAILWTIYLVITGASDNILKPILLGKGAPVPMLVIFLGVVGGFIFSGFIGLFTGAIVLSLGYKLFIAWID